LSGDLKSGLQLAKRPQLIRSRGTPVGSKFFRRKDIAASIRRRIGKPDMAIKVDVYWLAGV